MDEAFLDVTKEARSRVAAGDVGHFQGHIHLNQVNLNLVDLEPLVFSPALSAQDATTWTSKTSQAPFTEVVARS